MPCDAVILTSLLPLLHTYVLPPVAVKVVDDPGQAANVPLIDTFSVLDSVTVSVAEAVQPLASVTVTE